MKESNELFTLCKKCYERTGWETPDWWGKSAYSGEYRVVPDKQYEVKAFADEGDAGSFYDHLPHYTSDYLLEKLPPALWVEVSGEGQQVALLALNMQGNGEAIAVYEIPYDKEFRGSYSSSADTPLQALLKLTLKLHEEGIL